MWWVARITARRSGPSPFPCAGLALAFLIRELDFFLDRFVADNLWQVFHRAHRVVGDRLHSYRNQRRFKIALARIWPSPGLTLLFAGAIILFAFVRLVGHEPFWMSILNDDYRRVIKLAVEEFIELMGYFLWMIGTLEYAFQARAIAMAEPQPAARRRREKRRHDAEGRF